jgi:isopentenyl-diphosphate delta-isomerase
MQDAIVSFDDEPLVLVDAADRELGFARKDDVHAGEGTLHRAFSVFLFDPAGRVLMQRRSAAKRLWPLYWSNSCCSHPRRGEDTAEAAVRRVREELAVGARLVPLFKFQYQARYGVEGSEHELCSVLAGVTSDPVAANPHEVAEWEWMEVADLDRTLRDDPDRYTPWLRIEWPRVRADHWDAVSRLGGR